MQKRTSPQIASLYLYILPAIKTAFTKENLKLAIFSFPLKLKPIFDECFGLDPYLRFHRRPSHDDYHQMEFQINSNALYCIF